MENPDHIHELIIGLFSGEITPEEKKTIQDWIQQSSENHQLYTELREIWLASGIRENPDHYDTEKAIKLFKSRISARERSFTKRLLSGDYLKYAAILVLLFALPLSYYFGHRSARNESQQITVSCAYGDRTNIVLPDSSLVWLNSGSTLSFNNNFEKSGRNLKLEGEAYFSVKKNKDSPFTVKTHDVEVEVLGTEFDLKAYPEENIVSATLVKGSLRINSGSHQKLIKPNQKVTYSKEYKQMSLNELTDTKPETEWKEGRLVFRNESLADLQLKLERWFDVEIVFADEAVKEKRFTGILQRESILEAVSYFALSKHVAYKFKGNKIIFYSNNQ